MSEVDRRVATPKAETAQNEPATCTTRLPPPKLDGDDDEIESQTIWQDAMIPPLPLQSQTSPPDHIRDKA